MNRFASHILVVTILTSVLQNGIAQSPAPQSLAGVSEVPGKLVVYGMTVGLPEDRDLAKQIPDDADNTGFIQVTGNYATWGALRSDSSLVMGGTDHQTPDLTEVNAKLVKLSVCGSTTTALDENGRGYIWGPSHATEVSPDRPLEKLVDIQAGDNQGYALNRSGELIFWGSQTTMNAERLGRFTEFQGRIAGVEARGWGGLLVTQDGEGFKWMSSQTTHEERIQGLGVTSGPVMISGAVHSYLIQNVTGEVFTKAGYLRGKLPKPPFRALFYENGIAIVEKYPRQWQVLSHSSNHDIEGVQTFLDTHQPSAIAMVGGPIQSNNPKVKGYGIIAIVPDGSTAPPAPSMTAPPASKSEPTPPAVSAVAGITEPRFLALHKVFDVERRAKVVGPFDKGLAALNEKLDGALEREEKASITKGDLDLVTGYRAEREALAEGAYPPTGATSSTAIKRFRMTWVSEKAKLDAERTINEIEILASFAEKIEALVSPLTTEHRIDEALAIRAFIESD